MFTHQFRFALGFVASALICTACNHASTELSPLVGSSRINGNVPTPSANFPQFTSLTFQHDGVLDASYVAANGALGHIVQSTPQIKQEKDSYTLGDGSTLHIIEGSRALNYMYDIHDGKLFLTPTDGNNALVYVRVPDPRTP